MKICVADDEKEVRESIIHKLKALFPNESVFDVQFGRTALEHILTVQPDLVFLDIRMPEMDGLDILGAVKKQFPAIHIAMLSGYDEFEYARKALKLGAIDYLLKPADREQLRELVLKVREERQTLLLKELEDYLAKLSNQYVFVHQLHCFEPGSWFDERKAKEIRYAESQSHCEQWAEQAGREPLFSFSVNSDYGGIVVSSETGNGTVFRAKNEFIGALTTGMEQWESRRFWQNHHPRPVTDSVVHLAQKQAAQLRQHILSVSKAGHYTDLEASVLKWLEQIEGMRMGDLKKECVNLMALLDEGLAGKAEIIVLEEEKIHYWTQWVDKHRTWEELHRSIRKFVLDGIRALLHVDTRSNTSWFEQAKQWVQASRDPNLSLESVADYVGVHPVTLSRIFKQQTGMTFVRFLVRHRLKHAEYLLLNTDKKINDISEQVGYIDYRYFRSLFKKEYGTTPAEYRKRSGRDAAGEEAE